MLHIIIGILFEAIYRAWIDIEADLENTYLIRASLIYTTKMITFRIGKIIFKEWK